MAIEILFSKFLHTCNHFQLLILIKRIERRELDENIDVEYEKVKNKNARIRYWKDDILSRY